MKILQSASKLVFLIVAVALCVFTYNGIVDAKDFIVLASMTFTYYFSRTTPPSTQSPSLG